MTDKEKIDYEIKAKAEHIENERFLNCCALTMALPLAFLVFSFLEWLVK